MTSFGKQFLSCVVPSQALELEKTHSRNEKFAMLDNLISELAVRSLRGECIVSMSDDEIRGGSIRIHNLSSVQSEFIRENFDFARQRERGNWTLPEKTNIDVGWLNLTHYFGDFSYFPLNAAASEACRVELQKSPEAVFLWSVFSPFMEKLLYPIELRSSLVGAHDLEKLKSIWEDLDDFYSGIGISGVEEMNVFRFRGGWSKLSNRSDQLEAKKKLLAGLSSKITPLTGAFYRLYALRSLIEQYYKKAKSDGIVKRKQVITKAFQPYLSGYFGGDWLALVQYLGERPHPDEQIVTALPKPQIYAGGAEKAKEIAQQQGISADEMEKVAAALWQKPSGASPIEERTACLKKYWEVFDELHARQKPGMKSLWGLIDEAGRIDFEAPRDDIFHPGLYLELFPNDLILDIERLWGTTMLNKYPESIVSEPFPHFVMANVLGPALSFWQNCALTAWFLCEGPYSRTDMEGLEHHQRYNLAKLEDLSAPVDKALFSELIEAEKKLGPEESIEKEKQIDTLDFGITISMSVSGGSRRAGFEKLRDIITRHRRAWTQKYFELYLKRLWESEISQAANAFFLKMSEKSGKPPTVKQFVSTASSPTKNWFGGDISLLYTAIGERIPFTPQKRIMMPKDKLSFVKNVAKFLPSKDFDYFGQQAGEENQKRYVEELAMKALSFIQLYEAIGEMPTLKDFSTKFKYHSPVLHEDENQAWEIYTAAIKKALQLSVSREQKSVAPKIAQQEVKTAAVEQKPKIEAATSRLSSKPPVISPPNESRDSPLKASHKTENKTDEAPVRRSWWDWLLGRK
jgi:hypothetical protein